ncbi:chorismate mutase [Tenggerimyces flavus]|uniref:chorismate mutase n=1 Tax=Tenggerimyces flavus TaxID=1708749 RepID=A0ABV7Y6S2_9ACTN|nr:chorismate mutase [Tenggerimyces flavus]MBM7790998.1 chorismate mutase [Tenggerimyces flavus]
MHFPRSRQLLAVFAATVAVSGLSALPAQATTQTPVRPVVHYAADRLAIADLVAASKWISGAPIEDPVREQQVLDDVARQAEELGADPDEMRTIFRDQIEASKVVQNGLHRRWRQHPSQAPTEAPGLEKIRDKINVASSALVHAVADTAKERARLGCRIEVTVGAVVESHERHFDALHLAGLGRALPSVCHRT